MTVRRFINGEMVNGEIPCLKISNQQVMNIIREINMKIKENTKMQIERKNLPTPKSC